ncbi:MAG: SpoVR family protein [Desulfobacterales bacterium]|nr:SpoVR family protein [Desulfobacterales bacterium]
MELIDQHTKKIMEGCKARARDAGLRFEDESLEYIVTNRDLLELSPKVMIPTLYDYWVHDVEVLREKGKYELYPGNPYETVINTRPAISFYNDNNPDWLNVMIFYHVLGHIDFFQNNLFFRHTWDLDFAGQALSDKRLIAQLRSEKGRWVDYVIEFTRSIDNLVAFHGELSKLHRPEASKTHTPLDFYFDVFLQTNKKLAITDYIKEVERYNACIRTYGDLGEQTFFAEVHRKHPEFETLFRKQRQQRRPENGDLIQFLMTHSEFLNRAENRWMQTVMEVVRKTSLFFQPQIRTKVMNEGWASYWHEILFFEDERIRGHEVEFARVNAAVTAMPRVGLNPYALGMRLFYDIEKMADQGHYSIAYRRLRNARQRQDYDTDQGSGRDFIFRVRENYCDFTFIHTFVDQDFVDHHKLFVAGKRLNQERRVWEYYIKSRSAEDYRQMLEDGLYHPPRITVAADVGQENVLHLVHRFEGKPLVRDFIAGTLMGVAYLWGAAVQLDTHELVATPDDSAPLGSVHPSLPGCPARTRRRPERPGPSGRKCATS